MLDDYQAVLHDFRALQQAIKGASSPPLAAFSGSQSAALHASGGAPLTQLENTRPAEPPSPMTEPSEAIRGMKEKVGTAAVLRGCPQSQCPAEGFDAIANKAFSRALLCWVRSVYSSVYAEAATGEWRLRQQLPLHPTSSPCHTSGFSPLAANE